MSENRVRRQCRLPQTAEAGALAAVSAVLDPALLDAASQDARRLMPLSVTIDFGAPSAPGQDLTVEAWVERTTRTLVFATAEARDAEGAVVASGSAVLKLRD